MDPAKQTKKTLLEEWIEGKKKTFRLIPKLLFFFLVTNDNKWPMTTSVSFWDKLDLLARMIVLKKKETIHWPNASEVVGEFNQKRNNIAALNWKKKHLSISFLRQGCFFAQLIGCNKKTVDSVNAKKKKMQQVRVKKLFHYWPFTIERKTRLFFFASQLMDCNTKKQKLWTQSMQKKKMQQVRVKKLFHYLLPLSVCHVSKGPMPGKTCRTANDYCVLLTLCFVG